MAGQVQRRSDVQPIRVNGGQFKYTACYCEENIYMLCKALGEQGLASPDHSDLYVVFISNDIQQVPFWRQRNSSTGPDGFSVWDYHVICVQKTSEADEALVWDLDTTLPFPVAFSLYAEKSLRPDIRLDKVYSRLFRVIKASSYLSSFASDRRHMKTPEGRWRAPPPPYECIKAADGQVYNLEEYNVILEEQVRHISVEEELGSLLANKYGLVINEDGFKRVFSRSRSRGTLEKLDTNSQQLVSHV
ncbi:hypothetical protein R1sor_023283 [Riccia sorocarpa]|uniref:Protein N-terminal glutamine amidohydrolase n=1 Tax=Riccia sorocarpa TaxID=122646 RepID=A0ABD3GM89_9MARC